MERAEKFQEPDNGIHRRRFLMAGAGALAAGAMWTTPSALRFDSAAAVGSVCGLTQDFIWGGGSAIPAGTGSFTGWNAGSVGGVTVTVDFATGNGVNLRAPNSIVMGGVDNNFSMQKSGASNNSSATVTLTFSSPVLGLDFTLLDVDTDDSFISHYTDRMVVNATRANGTAISPTTVTLGSNVAGTGTQTPRVSGSYPTFTGTGTADQTETAGNVRLVWPSTNGSGVKKVTVTYTSLPNQGYGSSTNQYAGISRLRFC